MPQLFSHIKIGSTKRTTIDLSHRQVTTSDFGYLIPICMREMVPNDDFVVTPNVFARLAPLAVPVYGKIECRLHHFFVPNRICYPKWDSWITQDPSNQTVPPYATVNSFRVCLADDPQINPAVTELPYGIYSKVMSNLGLNPEIFGYYQNDSALADNDRINILPFLAYYRIWLDYFCDSNINDHPALVEAFKNDVKNGGNFYATLLEKYIQVRNCCYKKDYYTTAKVNPQDGDPALVGVDIASSDLNPGLISPVTSSEAGANNIRYNDGKVFNNVGTNSPTPSSASSKIGQFTVEAMRAASSLQRYKERNNYVGTKLINRLLAHFGISPEPERLDMAEFIGGDSFPIGIQDVTSTATKTSSTTLSTRGLGEQAGKGIIPGSGGKSVRYHAKEHGIFMTLMSIVPSVGYYQALPRLWSRGVTGDALDYYTPEFENLGYQVLLNKEVYVPNSNETETYQTYDPDGIFGYTPQYADYKFQNDILGSDFINNSYGEEPGTMGAIMDSWHLFRKLKYDDDSPLALNSNFVELDRKNADFDRIFQVTNNDYDHFYFNIHVDVKATRPMTGFTEPSLDATNEGDGRDITLPYGGTRL